ncbi:hypothetical protein LXL04_032339 [Taraxacum kok-saghyz]
MISSSCSCKSTPLHILLPGSLSPVPIRMLYPSVSMTGICESSTNLDEMKLWVAPGSISVTTGCSITLPLSFIVFGEVNPATEFKDISTRSSISAASRITAGPSSGGSSAPPSSSSSSSSSKITLEIGRVNDWVGRYPSIPNPLLQMERFFSSICWARSMARPKSCGAQIRSSFRMLGFSPLIKLLMAIRLVIPSSGADNLMKRLTYSAVVPVCSSEDHCSYRSPPWIDLNRFKKRSFIHSQVRMACCLSDHLYQASASPLRLKTAASSFSSSISW